MTKFYINQNKTIMIKKINKIDLLAMTKKENIFIGTKKKLYLYLQG